MTKGLSFAEWLGQQDSNEVDFSHDMCSQEACPLNPVPNCQRLRGWEKKSCPLTRLYEKQRQSDLQRWEKWNNEILL